MRSNSAAQVALFSFFSFLPQVALADFPLYIPGFDPQPLSATVLGVGSDGRTTYQISPAKATDPNDDDSSNPTFTLVEGPTDAVLTMQLPVITGAPDIIYESCSFGSNKNGQAICVVSASGTDINIPGVQTETDEVVPFTVLGNIAGGSAPAPTSTSGGSSVVGSTSPSSTTGGTNSPSATTDVGSVPSTPSETSSVTDDSSASNSAASPTTTGAAVSIGSSNNALAIGAAFILSLLISA